MEAIKPSKIAKKKEKKKELFFGFQETQTLDEFIKREKALNEQN